MDSESEAVAPDGATTETNIWWCEKGGSEVMGMGDRHLVVVCSKICVLVDGTALLGRRGDLLGDTWCIETLSYFQHAAHDKVRLDGYNHRIENRECHVQINQAGNQAFKVGSPKVASENVHMVTDMSTSTFTSRTRSDGTHREIVVRQYTWIS